MSRWFWPSKNPVGGGGGGDQRARDAGMDGMDWGEGGISKKYLRNSKATNKFE
jgi:hypothetical protein